MTTPTSGYYAPLAVTRTIRVGAWTLDVGTTPAGEHVVEALSTAAARPQRLYFETAAAAVEFAEKFGAAASAPARLPAGVEGHSPFNDATRSLPCDVCETPIGDGGRYGLEDHGDPENGPRLDVTWARCQGHVDRSAALPPVGRRVRLTQVVERYPHFLVEAGATGVVTQADGEMYAVRLDETIEGAEEWDNEVQWYLPNGDDPTGDVETL